LGEIEASSHFLENRLTDGVEVVSLKRRPTARYPQEVTWYSFLLEAESNPRDIVRLEGLGQLKNPIISSDSSTRPSGL
jgi:hypothetical protein